MNVTETEFRILGREKSGAGSLEILVILTIGDVSIKSSLYFSKYAAKAIADSFTEEELNSE